VHSFTLQGGELFVEQVPLREIAGRFGTPCYVYSRAEIEANYRQYAGALAGREHEILYAVKANANLAVLGLLAELGAGFDIVSGGELERVLRAGGAPERIVFAGTGKTGAEIERALKAGIRCFSVESAAELERIAGLAERRRLRARIAVRVNPDVDAKTHPYIATGLLENKFGVPIADAPGLYARAARMPALEPVGVGCHIGSQLTELEPFRAAVERIVELAVSLRRAGIDLRHIDIGGGLGIRYRDEHAISIPELMAAMSELVDRSFALWVAPGRSIIGSAGALLTTVLYLKAGPRKRFAIVDAAMNDLIRPSLYGAWHEIRPVQPRESGAACLYDVVGPVCESGDFLGRDRELDLRAGDLLAVMNTGAYGYVMASVYNSRPRPPEVLVDGAVSHLVRRRETPADMMRGEMTLSQMRASAPR
jgi:diaminopimelate decarboxylase